MSADLRHMFISPQTREWSNGEDQNNWTEPKPDNHERRTDISSIFGTLIQSAISFFTPKDEEQANSSTSTNLTPKLCEATQDKNKAETLKNSSQYLKTHSTPPTPDCSAYQRSVNPSYNPDPRVLPALPPEGRNSFTPSYTASLQNHDPNPHSWSSNKLTRNGSAYLHRLPEKFASYQPLSSISTTQNVEYRKNATEASSRRKRPHDHTLDSYGTHYPPSEISQSETRNYYNTAIGKHMVHQKNSPNSFVFEFIENDKHSKVSPLAQGPLRNRFKRPFNHSSYTPNKSLTSRSFSEVRSDILPPKKLVVAPSSPSFTELSHKRMKGTYEISNTNYYDNSKVDFLRSRASSVRSISYIPNLPSSHKNTFNMDKTPDLKPGYPPSLQEQTTKNDEFSKPIFIHTRTSQEFRLNFSLNRILTSLDSLLSNFMLKEIIQNSPKYNDLDPASLEAQYSDPANIPKLNSKAYENITPILNDRAGLLLRFYGEILQVNKKKLGSIIKSTNKWNNLDNSYSRFTTQLHGFNRDEPVDMFIIPKSDSIKGESESTASDESDLSPVDDHELLQDLQSLFPGSTPTSKCLDRFISVLNQRKHMYAETSEELIIDTENSSLPITSCTSSLKFPVWESIDYQGFLKSQSSPIKELTWHFEKVLERLTWGATNNGRVILPIYGRLIGFLLIYEIDDKMTISFSIINVSYPISEEERKDTGSNITTLTSLIENNIRKFVYALNTELKLSLTLISKRSSSMIESLNITEKPDCKISSILAPIIGEDTGLNLFICIDSLYTGFNASYVDESCKYAFRFLYQQSIAKYFL